ncbi:MAG TPA: hypothetical protein VK668_10210 [Mucilaginibacter sp.]|nr:hypothetical protein [Mucilaginibacter sp.]
MKSIILALILLVAGSTVSLAQCDKKITLSSSKTQHLDGSGVLQNTEDEQVVIDITKSDIIVVAENGNHKMTGKIKSLTCNWKVPFKEGKTVIGTTLNDDNGDSKDFTITIEGKEGKVTLLAESPQMEDRKIKLALDKFEEKN